MVIFVYNQAFIHIISTVMAVPDKSEDMLLIRLGKLLAVAGITLVFGFVAGLQYFVLTLPKPPSDAIPISDGIVVITGGQQRLSNGLKLLKNGLSTKMLVSGVGPGVSKSILAAKLGLDADSRAKLECCVELEFKAGDTRGNARAAAQWAEHNNLKSLLLVTANYHMPRAEHIFRREISQLTLQTWPVNPDDFDPQTWWRDASILRLLSREYAKYLAESLR